MLCRQNINMVLDWNVSNPGNDTTIMEDKQKVTLYMTSDLHRQLKIKAAMEMEPMSTLAERALAFYLQHPEITELVAEQQCNQHRVYSCPACSHPAVIRDGEMVALGQQPGLLAEEFVGSKPDSNLVSC
jgi:hypothetical protein